MKLRLQPTVRYSSTEIAWQLENCYPFLFHSAKGVSRLAAWARNAPDPDRDQYQIVSQDADCWYALYDVNTPDAWVLLPDNYSQSRTSTDRLWTYRFQHHLSWLRVFAAHQKIEQNSGAVTSWSAEDIQSVSFGITPCVLIRWRTNNEQVRNLDELLPLHQLSAIALNHILEFMLDLHGYNR